MRGVSSRGSENTVLHGVSRVARNRVWDGALAIGYRIRPEGQRLVHCTRGRDVQHNKSGVYLEHEFEDLPRPTLFARANFKLAAFRGTIPMPKNFRLERTI
jgi:hypothetical protein